MKAIDMESADAVGGGLTLAAFLAALALSAPTERGTSAGGWFEAGD